MQLAGEKQAREYPARIPFATLHDVAVHQVHRRVRDQLAAYTRHLQTASKQEPDHLRE